MEYRRTTPCTVQDLAPLKAGDTVLLSGVVYTARDQAHKRMTEALDKGETLPFDLEGSAIYYVGPTPERPGEVIGSAGPTTAAFTASSRLPLPIMILLPRSSRRGLMASIRPLVVGPAEPMISPGRSGVGPT